MASSRSAFASGDIEARLRVECEPDLVCATCTRREQRYEQKAFHAKAQRRKGRHKEIALCVFFAPLRLCVKYLHFTDAAKQLYASP